MLEYIAEFIWENIIKIIIESIGFIGESIIGEFLIDFLLGKIENLVKSGFNFQQNNDDDLDNREELDSELKKDLETRKK